MTATRETSSGDREPGSTVGWRAVPGAGPAGVRVGFASKEERQRVLNWLNDGLRPDRPGRLVQEYPIVFARESRLGTRARAAEPIVAWQDDEPVAFATLWPVTFRIGLGHLRVGLVSHVYTDPDHRGAGHATRVIRGATRRAATLDLGLVLLWSELDGFYRRLGFARAGEETLLVVDRAVVDRASSSGANVPSVETARREDWPEIERLRGGRTCRLELDSEAFLALSHVPDLDVQVARGDRGVTAFAMRGRGDDLQEVIHEWGGHPEDALACCRALLDRAAPWNELFLMAPTSHDELAWRMRRAGARVVRQPLGWMRVGSTSALADDLASLLPDQDGLTIEPGSDEGELRLASPSGRCQVAAHALLDGLFGSGGAIEPIAIRRRLGAVLGDRAIGRLPIPFHVAGLESI